MCFCFYVYFHEDFIQIISFLKKKPLWSLHHWAYSSSLWHNRNSGYLSLYQYSKHERKWLEMNFTRERCNYLYQSLKWPSKSHEHPYYGIHLSLRLHLEILQKAWVQRRTIIRIIRIIRIIIVIMSTWMCPTQSCLFQWTIRYQCLPHQPEGNH